MNKQKKSLIFNFVTVVVVTTLFILIMSNVKDVLNKSESLRAMRTLGEQINEYYKKKGSLPPESHILASIRRFARIGKIHYRAQWIGFDSPGNSILAYSKRDYRSFVLEPGYVVLRLDGNVEWMDKRDFELLFAEQQNKEESEMLQRQLRKEF